LEVEQKLRHKLEQEIEARLRQKIAGKINKRKQFPKKPIKIEKNEQLKS
jgi:hypothetical protein